MRKDPPRRVLGIDLGDKRIGVALSDGSGTLASPFAVIDAHGERERGWPGLTRIARETEAAAVVVGVPVSMDGTERDAARNARAAAEEIATALGVPVETWDERLSTVEATRRLSEARVRVRRRRRRVDASAAAVVLQGWLDAHRCAVGGGRDE